MKVSREAKRALLDNPRQTTLNDLQNIVHADRETYVRKAVAELVDRIGTWDAIPLLVELAADGDQIVANTARRLGLRRINQVFTVPNEQQRAAIERALSQCELAGGKLFATEYRDWLQSRRA